MKRNRLAVFIVTVVRSIVPVALIGVGIYGAIRFNESGTVQSVGSPDRAESARPVEIVVAKQQDNRVVINAMGTVMPAREAILRPRVSGMVIEQNDAFVPGAFLSEGDFVLQIDREDYEQAIQQREAELARAQANLKIELGDQALAREELELLELDIPDVNRELILRIPQVDQAKAEVRSAEAALKRARLDLERTTISAPFDGSIVERSITAGNNIDQGDAIATFVGSDRYWVELAVPSRVLRWIDLPSQAQPLGSSVIMRNTRAWSPDATREGQVTQLVARLEENSRQARVIVEIADPTARKPENAGQPVLLLDDYLECELNGRLLPDSFRIARDYVREGDTVWIANAEDRLSIKTVEIAYRGNDYVYITGGLSDGDRVIRTNLLAPVEGMLLRDATADSGSAVTSNQSPLGQGANGG